MGVSTQHPPPLPHQKHKASLFFLFIQKVLKRSPVKKVLIGVSVGSKEMLGIKKAGGCHRHGYLLQLALITTVITALNVFHIYTSLAHFSPAK